VIVLAVLDAAYAAGIRYVDAARSAGGPRFLAAWLAARDRRRRDRLEVGLPLRRRLEDGRRDARVKDHSLAAFTQQWATSASGRAGRDLPRALGDAGQRR
jgi:aryl-alcohol dehydrogenase-like predicted oxidoreductase